MLIGDLYDHGCRANSPASAPRLVPASTPLARRNKKCAAASERTLAGGRPYHAAAFYCDYGRISSSANAYFSIQCVVLDVCRCASEIHAVRPAVQISPRCTVQRSLRRKQEFGKPVEIGRMSGWRGALVLPACALAREPSSAPEAWLRAISGWSFRRRQSVPGHS